jgi:septation ring formation regulator EzrA
VKELKVATKSEEAIIDSMLEKYNSKYRNIARNSNNYGELLKILDERRKLCE